MSNKYDLSVNLIMPQYQVKGQDLKGVQVGGRLEGEVVLVPFEEVNCRGVWLEIGYNAKGKGTPHTEKLFENMIFQGKLSREQPLAYQITFDIPAKAPVSYAGEYVRIEWFVQIRIDIPFWFDIREEFPFRVLPCFAERMEELNLEQFRTDTGPETPFPW